MAYTGFIANPEYTRRGQDEDVTGQWTFDNEITFKKVIRGTAIATYYGDLAEYYQHEFIEVLPKGTLVKFGGQKEITKTKKNDRNFFGIISSEPAIKLNTKNKKDDYLPVALCGRVPCRITGKIKKFDKLTTSRIPGVAKKKNILDCLLFKPTIGIALNDKDIKTEKLIEIFIHNNI